MAFPPSPRQSREPTCARPAKSWRLGVSFLCLLAAPTIVDGGEPDGSSNESQAILNALIDSCVAAGGLRSVGRGAEGNPGVAVVDAGRIESVVAAKRDLRQQERDLRLQLRDLDRQIAKQRYATTADPDSFAQLLAERTTVEAQFADLIGQIQHEFPQYAEWMYPQVCTLEEARRCLRKNEVGLLYVSGTDNSCAVLLEGRDTTADGRAPVQVYPLPGAAKINEYVRTLTDMAVTGSRPRMRALAAEGFAMLMSPFGERIQGKDLLIVPSRELAQLPFEMLVCNDGKFLVENHRIRYAPSLTSLQLIRRRADSGPPKRLLWAVGDPIYNHSDVRLKGETEIAAPSRDAISERVVDVFQPSPLDLPVFGRLHSTGREIEGLRELFELPPDGLLTGWAATEAAVKEASRNGTLRGVRYLHFATHGTLGMNKGIQPSLVLSLVNNANEDGFLEMDEVMSLELNADLCVLSGCHTGQGKLYNGEGVRGLARAFLYAGSRAVVCSLWSVDDRETTGVVTGMYRRLLDGQSSADALRAAKLEMMREGKAPLYWAAFVLIGD